MKLSSLEKYGRGSNGTRVELNGKTQWYSYKTLVGFRHPKRGLVVHQNDWGTTTGGHLNNIDGGSPEAKRARVGADEFAKLFAESV